ncbi:MAG: aldehyde ferredoxin oxidoreductase N-terminal domain-containing protein, partial [Chloroflexota bacterium]|nr:aldehyde ferredoxin oxidoreductase N-terminal domain-containing protein [Chloroflexota bacterium]
LTQRQLREEKVDEATLRKYLGGMGLGASYLYDEVNPEINWDDPANRLILASGPLGGTIVDGTGCFSITTKGPITNGAGCSQANGFFGAFLKFSGFDAVVVQGQSSDWTYLYLHDGVAELRDARRLVGKDTWETDDLIKEEIGKTARQASVCCIGPAGENRVKFAAIVSDKGHVAGHNGMGAVMGAKKLKAIAVARGKPRFAVKDRERLAALAKEVFAWRIQDPEVGKKWFEWGTTWIYGSAPALGQLPVKNLTTSVFPEAEKFTGAYCRPRWKIKPNPCWACRNHHCYLVEVTEGPYAGFKGEEGDYEVMAAFGSLIGQTDAGAATMLANECDKLGLEGIEAGWLISWLIECYERGLITREQADGLPMNWGNVEAVKTMLGKISHREGFGDFLAEG